ncbi:hypothetical protein GCM10022379_61200 [Micromonospora maritima]
MPVVTRETVSCCWLMQERFPGRAGAKRIVGAGRRPVGRSGLMEEGRVKRYT